MHLRGVVSHCRSTAYLVGDSTSAMGDVFGHTKVAYQQKNSKNW